MSLSDKELKEIAYLARINIDENSFPALRSEERRVGKECRC
jgi:hypothetical protein